MERGGGGWGKEGRKRGVTEPIIFTYPPLPASRHVILNGGSDSPEEAKALRGYGCIDEAVAGNSLHAAAAGFYKGDPFHLRPIR